MDVTPSLTCLVCDRSVDAAETGTHRAPRFDDACICRDCLAGERDGYGPNAESVRRQLARMRADPGGPRAL